MLRNKGNQDMTTGSIWRHIVSFAVPMLFGLIFQQLYNTVDTYVVGNFVGKDALAAVGSAGPIINTLVGFFAGLSTGASVVIARLFGAHDNENLSKAVHTTMVLTLFMAVLFTVLGNIMIPFMLKLMKTPEDVVASSTIYLRIYFSGVIGLMVYNMGAGILRAVGDSRRPLYFLIFSAIVNIVGDLVLVLVFDMGVAGVAYATILSQCLSAVLILLVLMRAEGSYRLSLKKLRLDMPMLKSIMKIGLPAAIQSTITSFSNVFVQSYINRFGSACMAGWSVYGKLDSLAMLPMMSIGMASTTFVGQNLGAGDTPRAKKGIRTALTMSLCSTSILLAVLMIFARPLLTIFTQEPDVLTFGRMFVMYISPFYLFSCVNDIMASSLRGAGQSKAPMIFMLSCYVAFRQVYLFVASRLSDSALTVGMGYPIGWMLCATCQVIYYKTSHWEDKQDKVLVKK